MAVPTFNEVYEAYLTHASYAEDGSVSAAKSFVTACRRLIAMRAKRSKFDGVSEVEFDVSTITKEKEAAERWLADNDTTTPNGSGGNTAKVDFSGWRD